MGFVFLFVYTMGNSIACLRIDGNDPITSKRLKMQQREGIREEVLRMRMRISPEPQRTGGPLWRSSISSTETREMEKIEIEKKKINRFCGKEDICILF